MYGAATTMHHATRFLQEAGSEHGACSRRQQEVSTAHVQDASIVHTTSHPSIMHTASACHHPAILKHQTYTGSIFNIKTNTVSIPSSMTLSLPYAFHPTKLND
jgi:hypothetical protein